MVKRLVDMNLILNLLNACNFSGRTPEDFAERLSRKRVILELKLVNLDETGNM